MAGREYSQAVDDALAWIARLRSDTADEAAREEFALWLAQDDSHGPAMDEAMVLWDEIGEAVKLRTDSKPSVPIGRWLSAAAALAACLLVALFLSPLSGPEPGGTLYQSALGERRSVKLPDGSRALLNTNSAIRVEITKGERRILLTRGEVWFQVYHDEERPFRVDAGDARVTALGTAFNVYRHGENTEIAVTEGVVRVTELGETGYRVPAVEILHVNETLHTSPGKWDVATAPDLEQQLAWREGRLVAQAMPLPELIEELSRYQATDYILTDPELAGMTVSGVFNLDQPESILRALELSLGLEARDLDEDTVHLLKAER